MIVDLDRFAWRVWDDGLAIYDTCSDEVHRFDALTGDIFEELRIQARSCSELAMSMSERLEVVSDQRLDELVAAMLQMLHDKDIIAPLA